MTKLSIVTLNYKKSHLTIRCVQSLYKVYKSSFEKGEIELLIVDNASPDDSVKEIKQELKKNTYKNITLIENPKNAGFGAGCNVGSEKSKGKYLLFLNNDTIVKDAGLEDMAAYLDTHAEVSILGGKLLNHDGTEQACVGSFYSPFKILLLLSGLQRFGAVDKNPRKIREVEWVKGGLLMMRKEVFKKLGGFDEKIFMYTEDMELCYRAHLQGFRVYFYPDVTVIHEETGSSNRTFAIVNIYKNLLYFYKKHRSHAEYLFVKFLLLAKARSLIGLGSVSKNSYLIQTYEEALKVI